MCMCMTLLIDQNISLLPGHQVKSSSRKTVLPSYLRDSVITDYVPTRNNSTLRAVVTSCIDRMEGDFKRRFSPENTTIWSSMESLIPSYYDKFLDARNLIPLFKYVSSIPTALKKLQAENLNESNLTAECHVYERVLRKELENGIFDHKERKGVVDLTKVCQYMVRSHAEAAPVLCLLYRIAVTAGYASARCECVFSSLTKVDAPQRRSQSVKRETNCTFLYFERKTLMELEFEDFYKIWVGKPRKLKFD